MKVSELIKRLLQMDQSLEVKKSSWNDANGEGTGWEEYNDIEMVETTTEYECWKTKQKVIVVV